MTLETLILDSEPLIRLGFFIGVFAAVALWEVLAPRRALTLGRTVRWASNLGIVALNTLIVRLLFPAAAVGVAAFCAAHGWGVFNLIDLPLWMAILLAVVAMDFVIWLQHVMVHAVPLLWRLHRVHHADLDYDVTTGARFHPLEIVLSMLIKFATIVVLGPPVVAVVIFEVLLNATSMFNHGNVRLPAAADRVLRLFVVTPDMHRVHHSVYEVETNSNYGFCLPWWDRLFGTYRAQPRDGHVGMLIGLTEFRDARQADRLAGMLAMPFRDTPSAHVINRRDKVGPEDRGRQDAG
ncbi:sterol desaturase family protein [Azoarcus taiwanensis]|uniref:Sterol desaturase family protein n=1 Tax=Azoarcus taiwanensis TaxID=666964 RepID=A0A972J8Z7_9RHOO|nr:sterol desaturase family protein [Azoarcus taiwanensis]NMG02350.1 sterol desaturase family protein [Azoarcus taiwanensis]